MKVRIDLELSDEQLRAIAAHYGHKRRATRQEVRSWADGELGATLETMVSDMDERREGADDSASS